MTKSNDQTNIQIDPVRDAIDDDAAGSDQGTRAGVTVGLSGDPDIFNRGPRRIGRAIAFAIAGVALLFGGILTGRSVMAKVARGPQPTVTATAPAPTTTEVAELQAYAKVATAAPVVTADKADTAPQEGTTYMLKSNMSAEDTINWMVEANAKNEALRAENAKLTSRTQVLTVSTSVAIGILLIIGAYEFIQRRRRRKELA